MGMFSEIANAAVVKAVAGEIKKEIELSSNPEVRATLKRIGRLTLDQLDYCTESWVRDFETFFAESSAEPP